MPYTIENSKPEPKKEKPLYRVIPETWRNTAGKYQAAHLGANIAGLSVLGYLAGKMAAKPLSMRLAHAISPEDRDAVKKKLSTLGAILGGLAGTYTGSRGLDFKNAESLIKSLFEEEYWKNNPDRATSRKIEMKEADKKTRFNQGQMRLRPGYDPMLDLRKSSSDTDGFSAFMPVIDLDTSVDLVTKDLYMDPIDKGRVNYLLEDADDDDDRMLSQFDISKSALRSGLGFVPSYFAGSLFGKVLKLPDPVRKRVSLIGGVAGAALNSGLLV